MNGIMKKKNSEPYPKNKYENITTIYRILSLFRATGAFKPY